MKHGTLIFRICREIFLHNIHRVYWSPAISRTFGSYALRCLCFFYFLFGIFILILCMRLPCCSVYRVDAYILCVEAFESTKEKQLQRSTSHMRNKDYFTCINTTPTNGARMKCANEMRIKEMLHRKTWIFESIDIFACWFELENTLNSTKFFTYNRKSNWN